MVIAAWSGFAAFAPCLFGHHLERLLEIIEVTLLEFLEVKQLVAGMTDGTNQLVQLDLNGLGVAVLGALNQEHHQEGDDRCAGIDDQLPGIAEAKKRAQGGPYHDDEDRRREGEWPSCRVSGPFGQAR